MKVKTGNSFISKTTTVRIEIPTVNLGYSITASSAICVQATVATALTSTTGNSNLDAKTGNFSSKSGVFDHSESSIKACPNNYDNDRHPEMELQLLWR